MSKQTGQISQAKKSNQGETRLKYDYSELDEFLQKDIEPENLALELRRLHCCFTDTLSQLINTNTDLSSWAIREPEIFMLEDFFKILNRLPLNEEGGKNENE